MKYLIDTHILIWWLGGSKSLSQKARNILKDPKNIIFVSVAVPWEIIIKTQAGKLKTPGNLKEVIAENNFKFLEIKIEHTLYLADLPLIHKDPFDRIQIAQAKVEKIPLITSDERVRRYGEFVLEA